MKEIMRAQLYQLKKEHLIYVMFFLCIILLMIAVANADEFDTFGEIICEMAGYLPQISLMFLFTVVAVVCGKDFLDHTGNYEIMSGHTRKEIFWGRTFLSILISVLGSLVICLSVIGMGCLIMDWGDMVSLKGILLRFILMLFPFFRIACEAVFVAFIVRNTYIVLAMGYVYIFGVTEIVLSISNSPNSFFLGFSNLIRLSELASFQTYSPANPDVKIVIYDTSLGMADVLGTVGVSVGIGILFLLLGYHFFKMDDIR